ncbi:MAG TPA: histidine ammonia-lyase [Bdellovibrionota bacterium]|jgi:histidine ammonia-lyase|nr:histidine ammonia-lyase [Bdellovibrionota bacterium]
MASGALRIGAKPLSLEDVRDVALYGRKVEIAPAAKGRILKSRRFLDREVEAGKTIYGVNTGFGMLSSVRIPDKDIAALQVNLLRSHATGVGHFMPDPVVRGMLLLRAHALAQGFSGVRLELVQRIVDLCNRGVHPLIPQQGSVGASGDLAPLAHLALVLIGEGVARVGEKVLSGEQALRVAGLRPIKLAAKEGLALINGTQFMTAIGVLTLLEAEHLADVADMAGAMTVEAMRGTTEAFDPLIQNVRPHPGQVYVAKRLRKIMGSDASAAKSQIAKSHEGCGKVQDPYSLRCMPQVHGACRDTLAFVRGVLERECNAVTDNPLVFAAQKRVISGGNFHGEIVAIAMDALSIAAAEFASISEQRIEKLVNPALSELPAFLAPKGGLNSGFMIVQVAAASIVSENKTLCHPASVDSIPTSADKEDHVSMGAWAARKAGRVVVNTRRVLAMELLAAAQGVDLLRPLKSTPAIERVHRMIRRKAPFAAQDRPFHKDIEAIERMLAGYELSRVV